MKSPISSDISYLVDERRLHYAVSKDRAEVSNRIKSEDGLLVGDENNIKTNCELFERVLDVDYKSVPLLLS
jgi:hypothetical protein